MGCGHAKTLYGGKWRCRACTLEQQAKYRNTCREEINVRHKERRNRSPWENAWYRMNQRAGNRDGNHPSYVHVEVRVSRETFYQWYQANAFPGCSVDRIDNQGHYELGNMQMLTVSENSQKQGKNPFAPPGAAWCGGHEDYLPVGQFFNSKHAANGLMPICKVCANERKKFYRRKKASNGV